MTTINTINPLSLSSSPKSKNDKTKKLWYNEENRVQADRLPYP